MKRFLLFSAVLSFAAGSGVCQHEGHSHEGHNHDGHDHGQAATAEEYPAMGNDWFDRTRVDLGTFLSEETAVGRFAFKNPRDVDHKLSSIRPSCACSKAILTVGERRYEVGSSKVLYRLDTADDGGETKVRVDHSQVAPGEEGESEVHMAMTGIKGRKEADLGLQTSDEELPMINLHWRATGATYFIIDPPEIHLNEMSWDDERTFEYTVSSPMKKDFNILGHEDLTKSMTVSYEKSMQDDGSAVWLVKGSYGPGASDRDNGGVIRLRTDIDDRVVTTRVTAFLKGPLTMSPGGFIGLGHIKRNEGKDVEITLTPTGDFDLQATELVAERLRFKNEEQSKFVRFTSHKDGKDLKVIIHIDKGMDPAYLSGVLKIHLNHPSVKMKEVMFNGFVR